MLKRLRSWWNQRARQYDIDLLWPTLRADANSLAHARFAFALHAAVDPAWRELSNDELKSIIEGLH